MAYAEKTYDSPKNAKIGHILYCSNQAGFNLLKIMINIKLIKLVKEVGGEKGKKPGGCGFFHF
ncbi:MAG: hypothetical protein CM15mP124_6850 [Alphaproteobacteria bacterium]|nr:MAG: hypothetical protein CM15mP124_6850 [Alphaproteobacteria bacterium]